MPPRKQFQRALTSMPAPVRPRGHAAAMMPRTKGEYSPLVASAASGEGNTGAERYESSARRRGRKPYASGRVFRLPFEEPNYQQKNYGACDSVDDSRNYATVRPPHWQRTRLLRPCVPWRGRKSYARRSTPPRKATQRQAVEGTPGGFCLPLSRCELRRASSRFGFVRAAGP
jgi:hypothetical protein